MKPNHARLFFLFALSFSVSLVICNEEKDDTVVVEAADLGEDGEFPEFSNIICRDTEEYSRCDANSDCQRSCDTIGKPIPCPRRSCIEGCICRRDFVRSELYGGCIPEDQCTRVKH